MKIKNPFKSATENLINQEVEKEFYLKAAEDIENNVIDKGLWTKAFVMSQGDDAKQKAIYIELIVEYYKNQVKAGEEVADILAKEEEKAARRAEKLKEPDGEWGTGEAWLTLIIIISIIATIVYIQNFINQ